MRTGAGKLRLSILVATFAMGCGGDPSGDGADGGQDAADSGNRVVCGDGVIDGVEECDDGAQNSDVQSDACRTDCTFPGCGDGVVDEGEECDDGVQNSDVVPDACRSQCRLSSCGDGVVDVLRGENCDHGGMPTASCGDTCQVVMCGNGLVEAGEVCDDGNTVSGDNCRADCQSDESCGNGFADPAAGEGCDCGTDPADLPAGCLAINGDAAGTCTAGCLVVFCGNGIVDSGEDCDDGNVSAGDGCGPTCRDEVCGNGFIDPTEECDDGNATLGDGCNAGCALEFCGSGNLDPGEECDDGGNLAGDGCGPTCLDEVCGNAFLDPGEECDDGNTVNSDGCQAGCTIQRCGDGVTDPGEVCDDGNTTPGDGCSADCLVLCGDGVIDDPNTELCDGGDFDGKYCVDYGFDWGRLSCSDQCTPNYANCQYLGWVPAPMHEKTLVALKGIHGLSADDLFVAGQSGKIGQWDGSAYSWDSVSTNEARALWVVGANEAYMVGRGGIIARFDGSNWIQEPSNISGDPNADLFGVFVTGGIPVAVGRGSVILARLGGVWQEVRPYLAGDPALTGVWGVSYDDLYVVGDGNSLLRVQDIGGSPTVTPIATGLPATTKLRSVWGTGSNDIHVVGHDYLLHYDGTAWTSRHVPGDDYKAVWGTGPDTAFAVGLGGLIAHYDGIAWEKLSSPGGAIFEDVWGPKADEMIVVGHLGRTYRHTGTVLIEQESGTTEDLFAVYARSRQEVYAVGNAGTILQHDPTGWSPMASPTTRQLRAIQGFSDGTMVAVGVERTALHYDGTSWTQTLASVSGAHRLNSIWGSASNDVWVAGETFNPSASSVWHWDGAVWEERTPEFAPRNRLTGVWGSGPNDVWFGQDGDALLHWDGASWSWVSTGISRHHSVWGTGPDEIFVVGPIGKTGRFDGVTWTSIPSGTNAWMGPLVGTSGSDVFAGSGLEVRHYDGVAWAPIRLNPAYNPSGMAIAGNDLFIVGDQGYTARLMRAAPWLLEGDCRSSFDATVGGYGHCDLVGGFEDISQTGTRAGAGDDAEYAIPIGFDFTFYGQVYTSLSAGSNGVLALGGVFNTAINAPLGAGVVSKIAVLWDDLDSGNGPVDQGIYYETRGRTGDRRLIVQWVTEHFPSGGTVSFQAVLFEASGAMELRYKDVDFGDPSVDYGLSATVGITGPSSFLQYSHNQAVVTNGTRIRFESL